MNSTINKEKCKTFVLELNKHIKKVIWWCFKMRLILIYIIEE